MEQPKIKIKKVDELPLYLRAREAQTLLGISPWVLYRLGYQQKIRTVRVGRIRLFSTKDVLSLLELEDKR